MPTGPDAPPERDTSPPTPEVTTEPGRAAAPGSPARTAPAPADEPRLKTAGSMRVARHLHSLVACAALALAIYAVAGGSTGDRSPASRDERPPATGLGSEGSAAKLAALEEEVRRLKLQQAVSLVEAALSRDRPFETELASAIVMADRDEKLLADLDRLGPFASRGVPTRGDLADALPKLVEEVRQAVRQPGMIGGATVLMRDLALGLGVGKLPEGSIEHLLRQVEQAGELGQLEMAAAKLRELPAGMTGRVSPWLQGFAAREASERALQRLRSAVARGALADDAA